MNSKEIVKRTLNFAKPARVAHSFYPSDFVWAGIHINAPQNRWKKVGDLNWQRTDEWGNIWQKKCCSARGKIIRGGLHNCENIQSYTFPDFSSPPLYNPIKNIFSSTADSYHIGVLTGSTFEIANSLIDHYLTLILTDIQIVRTVHDNIDSILKTQARMFKEADADAIMIIEDLGDTREIPLAPSLWKEEFKPRFQELCDFAHSIDLKVIIHSLQEFTLIPEFIQCGVDCIQLDNPESIGFDALKTFRDLYKISFWCPLDIYTTLQSHNEKLIRHKAREMLQMLWRGEGGFIAGYFYDNLALGLDPKWQEYANDEFLKFGKAENFTNY